MCKQDILLAGVGGQGIILSSDIIGEVAVSAGLDVKKSDTLGMAQRGGSVTSHLRIAEKVWAPLISPAEADILLAFEKLEALRWANFMRPKGIAIINNIEIPPLSISLGLHRYPADSYMVETFKQRTDRIYVVNGSEEVKKLGDIRALNIFMIGVVSVFLPYDIPYETWERHIRHRLPAKVLDVNIKAFGRGREVAYNANI